MPKLQPTTVAKHKRQVCEYRFAAKMSDCASAKPVKRYNLMRGCVTLAKSITMDDFLSDEKLLRMKGLKLVEITEARKAS